MCAFRLAPRGRDGTSMKCAYPPCPVIIEKPRPKQRFHASRCRWADWRRLHPPPLRCPNCRIILLVSIDGATVEGSQRRSARQNSRPGG